MIYQEAFEAVKNGDFETAIPLLEKAAAESGFASDIVNNAYTLALYRAGDKKRLAEVAFAIGNLLVESDPGSAMDYFQRAFLGGLDEPRVQRVGEVFEGWAGPRADGRVETPIRKVAHVVGAFSPDKPATAYVKLLSESLGLRGVESLVFTTESDASWFTNTGSNPQSGETAGFDGVLIASLEGDFAERAERVAAAIRASGASVAFYHAGLDEQITARVATLRPSPVQVHVNHGAGMAALFEGYVHLSRRSLARMRQTTAPAEWMPPASDIQVRMQKHPSNTRREMGLESAGSVSATFGDLSRASGAGYLHAIGEILKRFPKHFHLFAGPGDVKAIRGYLHAEGVLPRVRFLGQMGDVASVIDAIDVYLASFPDSGERALVEAMGAGKPAVALQYPSDSPYNAAAEIVGIPELIATGEAGYVEIANRLIRHAENRTRLSTAVSTRFDSEFAPVHLGTRYLRFVDRVLKAL